MASKRMTLTLVVLLGLAPLAGASACTSFSAAPIAGSDAGSSVDDAKALGADAATREDGSSLVGRSCATVVGALFCDDFDDAASPRAPPFGWSDFTTNGGNVTRTTTATSAPNALRSEITGSGNGQIATIYQGFALQAEKASLDFDLYLERPNTTTDAKVLVAYIYLSSATSSSRYTIDMTIKDDLSFAVVEDLQGVGDEKNGEQTCGTLPVQRWIHAAMSFDFTASPPTESLTIDGGVPCTRVLMLNGSLTRPYSTLIKVGIPWADDPNGGSWAFVQDNVVFRAN